MTGSAVPKTRRANGEGSIYPFRNGFAAKVWVRDPSTGASRRAQLSGRTRDEVAAKVRAAVAASDSGKAAVASRMTVTAYADRWMSTTLDAKAVGASTRRLYRHALRSYVKPVIGDVPLSRLVPRHVEDVDLWMRRRDRPLSDSTRRTAYNVLSMLLDTAVRDGLIAANPAARIDRPVQRRRAQPHYTAAQAHRLVGVVAGHRTFAHLVPVMLYTGLRPGEALALRWEDVDLDAGLVTVTGTLSVDDDGRMFRSPWAKGLQHRDRPPRGVPLVRPARDVLRAARAGQVKERLLAGSAWTDNGLVFTDELGRLLDDRTLRVPYRRFVADAGLTGSFHALRRSTGTLLTDVGTPLPVVSAILGHASIAITATHYVFADNAMQRRALEALEARLDEAQ